MIQHEDIEGLAVIQSAEIEKPFSELAKVVGDVNIIELGTAAGGFSVFLAKIFKQKIYTFDTRDIGNRKDIFKKYNIEFKLCDVLNTNTIKELIEQDKPCLLLCDNGHKITEFNKFAGYLKSGDIIMAHDYCQSIEYYYKYVNSKHWNYCEITDEHIIDSCKRYNLLPFMQEIFINVAWKICKKF